MSALRAVYALSAVEGESVGLLTPPIAQSSTFVTALPLRAGYAVAPMCLATVATFKHETFGWRMHLSAASYLFGLAYLTSFATYQKEPALRN